MPGLEELLELDVSDALARIDDVEAAMTAAAQSGQRALSEAFESSLGDAEAAAGLVGDALADSLRDGSRLGLDFLESELAALPVVDVEVEADTASAAAAIDELDDGTVVSVPVETDTTGVTDALSDLEDLAGVAAPEAIRVDVDDSQVTEAIAEVEALGDAADSASTSVSIDAEVSGSGAVASMGDEAAGTAGALGGLSLAASAGTQGLGGLSDAAGSLIPVWGKYAAGAAGAAAGVGILFDAGVSAEAGNRRLEASYGDLADELQDISTVVGDLPEGMRTLKDLTLATGSSGAGLKTALANYADLGRQSHATNQEIVDTGKQFGVLANYVAATRPEMGTADQIAGRLSTTLARGGRFAAQMGLDIGNSGEIAARASEMYGLPIEQLSIWQKSTAGLQVAYERLGPSIGSSLEEAVQNPVVKLRSLERELKATLAAAGQPLVQPLVDALTTLEPLLEGVAGSFGNLAGSVLPGVLAAAQPVLTLLGAVAGLFARIPGPVFAAATAFLAVRSSIGPLFAAIQRVGPMLGDLSRRLGSFATGARFDSIVAQFKGVDTALLKLNTTEAQGVAANTAYAESLRAQVGSNAAAVAALNAHTVSVAADNALLDAATALGAANVEVRDAQAAAAAGEVGAESRLIAAREAQVVATRNMATAETAAAEARAASTAASAAAIDGAIVGSVELQGAAAAAAASSAATAEAAEGVALAGASAGGATALLGPLSIALGVGAAAWALFGSSSGEASEDVTDATDTLEGYRTELGLTNTQLAALSTSRAQGEFQKGSVQAEKFWKALQDRSVDDDFNDLHLDLQQAGAALAGDTAAAKAFRQALVDAGEVRPEGDDYLPEKEVKDAQRAFVEYGRTVGETTSGATYEIQSSSGIIAQIFNDQTKAGKDATDALLETAKAEVEGGDAANTLAIQTLAATGQLGLLGDKGESSARALLRQSEAQEEAARTAIGFDAALQGANESQRGQLEATQRAVDSFANRGSVDLGDLGAARAIQSSQAWELLDEDTRNAVKGLTDYADQALETAKENGELVSSLGEVSSSFLDLNAELATAVDRYDQLAAATGRQRASFRDVNRDIRDIGEQTKKYGTSLNDLVGTKEQRDNADSLLDHFDQATDKIRSIGEAQLKSGEPVAKVQGQVAEMVADFRQAALDAGVSVGEIDSYLMTVGLNSITGFSDQQLDTSGITKVTEQIAQLSEAISLLPPDKQIQIRAITDPEQQRQAIEEAVASQPPEVEVAVRTALAAPTPEEAAFALDSVRNFLAATHAVVQIHPELSPDAAANGIAALNAYNADPAHAVKIVPTIDNAAAAAQIEAAYSSAIAAATAKVDAVPWWDIAGKAAAESEVQELTRQRDVKLTVLADPASVNEARRQVDELTAPGQKAVTINFKVPEWAKRMFGIDRSAVPAQVQVDVTPTVGRRSDVPSWLGPMFGRSEGGARVGQTRYSAGGSTDPKADESLARAMAAGHAPKPPDGFYPGGSYITFAEDATGPGEYLISRNPNARERNQDLVRMAARDLGVTELTSGPMRLPRPVEDEGRFATGGVTDENPLAELGRALDEHRQVYLPPADYMRLIGQALQSGWQVQQFGDQSARIRIADGRTLYAAAINSAARFTAAANREAPTYREGTPTAEPVQNESQFDFGSGFLIDPESGILDRLRLLGVSSEFRGGQWYLGGSAVGPGQDASSPFDASKADPALASKIAAAITPSREFLARYVWPGRKSEYRFADGGATTQAVQAGAAPELLTAIAGLTDTVAASAPGPAGPTVDASGWQLGDGSGDRYRDATSIVDSLEALLWRSGASLAS